MTIYNSKIELERRRMIKERMEEIKKINKLENECFNKIKLLSKEYDEEIRKSKKLSEERKKILTELDVLAK